MRVGPEGADAADVAGLFTGALAVDSPDGARGFELTEILVGVEFATVPGLIPRLAAAGGAIVILVGAAAVTGVGPGVKTMRTGAVFDEGAVTEIDGAAGPTCGVETCADAAPFAEGPGPVDGAKLNLPDCWGGVLTPEPATAGVVCPPI
jgi:hypothetical protein